MQGAGPFPGDGAHEEAERRSPLEWKWQWPTAVVSRQHGLTAGAWRHSRGRQQVEEPAPRGTGGVAARPGDKLARWRRSGCGDAGAGTWVEQRLHGQPVAAKPARTRRVSGAGRVATPTCTQHGLGALRSRCSWRCSSRRSGEPASVVRGLPRARLGGNEERQARCSSPSRFAQNGAKQYASSVWGVTGHYMGVNG